LEEFADAVVHRFVDFLELVSPFDKLISVIVCRFRNCLL
jgi:hypothetical protein